MRKYFIIPLFLIIYSASFAQESITITSYYPSPYGVYKELRLYPNSSPSACDANNRGAMYYNSVNNEVRVCNGTDWQVVGPTPSGAVMFFNLASCPAGWTELAGARGRYIVGLPSGGTLAATVGTALSNAENRNIAGPHTHSVSDPGHMHSSPVPDRSTANSSTPPGATYYTPLGLSSADTVTGSSVTGVTVNSAGTGGTNSPYIQLLACQKD